MYWEKETKRIIKRFAFLPISICEKCYWLQIVYIDQWRSSYYCKYWMDSGFVSKRAYQQWKKERKERLKNNDPI